MPKIRNIPISVEWLHIYYGITRFSDIPKKKRKGQTIAKLRDSDYYNSRPQMQRQVDGWVRRDCQSFCYTTLPIPPFPTLSQTAVCEVHATPGL